MSKLGSYGSNLRKFKGSIFIGEGARSEILHGNYIQIPFMGDEENLLLEEISEETQAHILESWDNFFDAKDKPFFTDLRRIFAESHLRVLYVSRKQSRESLEWVLQPPPHFDLGTLAGVYHKCDMQFLTGKFHDIVCMGTTSHVVYDVNVPGFESDVVLLFVELASSIRPHMDNDPSHVFDENIWYIVLSYAVDCVVPISSIHKRDVVLADERRSCRNLFLSDDLHMRYKGNTEEKIDKDPRVLPIGRLFMQIGITVDEKYSARIRENDAVIARENSIPRRFVQMYKNIKSNLPMLPFMRTQSQMRPARLGGRHGQDITNRARSAQESRSRDMGALRDLRMESPAVSPRNPHSPRQPRSPRSPRSPRQSEPVVHPFRQAQQLRPR